MQREAPVQSRLPRTIIHEKDFVVVGGGLSGVCAAVTAARRGLKVALVQDRPVLGGNSSSEVRLWVLGATSHMGNNNRWAREGGVIDEILVENLYRNPEGNPVIFDTVVLEIVAAEPNLTLLLNTAVSEVEKSGGAITAVHGFCPQSSTRHELRAPLFCDASGDGIVAFLAGAAFRMGAESREEFGEGFAPTREYGELLGHTIYFYSKDTGRPVTYVPPKFALCDITKIPRYRQFNARQFGCQLWWIEYGGRLDTVHETETIKWELWSVVYGVWNYIKNSGKFPEADTLALEWVGTIPGKRESRRFEGDYILRQQDIIEQRWHEDAVSFGGWSIDLHPADGVFSERPGCNQWHSRGVFQIPYRTLYSRNIENLFLAGRVVSSSHVAFGSTRVMGTCAHSAQAAGMAAFLCRRENLRPRDVPMPRLQRELMRAGQHIPGFALDDAEDLARRAFITASSELRLARLPAGGPVRALDVHRAQMLPVPAGRVPLITLFLDVAQETAVEFELRTSDRPGNHTPDVVLARRTITSPPGRARPFALDFDVILDQARYVFVCVSRNAHAAVHCSEMRLTGILSVANGSNAAVSNQGLQRPPPDIGVETFEFWCPERRPGGHNLAMEIEPPLEVFAPAGVTNGIARPTSQPNAWVADPADPAPTLGLRWDGPQKISRIELGFDSDFDHPMESVLMGHPERVTPFCVKTCAVLDGAGRELARLTDNHQTRALLPLQPAAHTSELRLVIHETHGAPAAIFSLSCYAE